jgi:ribonuclease-3
MNTEQIEGLIKYKFKDKKLLRQAFSHSSYAFEAGCESNERLEFVGDSLFNFIISDLLSGESPTCAVGDLSKKKAALVSNEQLSGFVRAANLERYLLLGKSFSGGKTAVSDGMCADLFEAIIGAIYLDGCSLSRLKKMIEKRFYQMPQKVDYKTRLQEIAQRDKKSVCYSTSKTGAVFVSEVSLDDDGKMIGTGEGQTKQAAEQAAAQKAVATQETECLRAARSTGCKASSARRKPRGG